MTRPLRLEFEGALYHITSRGDRRENIYETDADRQGFLSLLARICEKYNWTCHAYCLMSNHYHLLVETPEANLSKGMRQLNGVYTQDFNRRNHCCGHVFQGRFKSILVDKEAYLLELTRYIVLNPVRAGMVQRAQDWPWSSFRATIGLVKKSDWLQDDWPLSAFGKNKTEAIRHYIKFVVDGMNRAPIWADLKHQIYLGDEHFIDNVQSLIDPNKDLSEIPSPQARPPPKLINEYLSLEKNRNQAIARAYQSGGYTLKEIASYFNLHYSTVSVIVRNSKSKT
jgi:REP element-mobilizing transposase RayT